MSIFIDGIEMPKDGHWGTVSIPFYIHGDGSVSDSKGHVIGSAVPVPPHGRLIDADALCNRLEKAGKIKPYLESGLNVAISFALTAPTIIPAEEEST